MCGCLTCKFVWVLQAWSSCRGQRRASEPPLLELQMMRSWDADAGNVKLDPLGRAVGALQLWTTSSAPSHLENMALTVVSHLENWSLGKTTNFVKQEEKSTAYIHSLHAVSNVLSRSNRYWGRGRLRRKEVQLQARSK